MRQIATAGPKCPDCGYGLNTGVTLPEQADLDAKRDEIAASMEAEAGRPLLPVEIGMAMGVAKQLIANSHLVATPAVVAQMEAEQLASCTSTLVGHVNDDGTCSGRNVLGSPKVDSQRAALPLAKRVEITRKVIAQPRYAARVRAVSAKIVTNAEDEMVKAGAPRKEAKRIATERAQIGGDDWTVAKFDKVLKADFLAETAKRETAQRKVEKAN